MVDNSLKQWLLENGRSSVVDEFVQELNPGINFDELTIGCKLSLNWRCSLGHEWSAVAYSRKRNGCPVCRGKMIIRGYNDLKTLNPQLAVEWDPDNELKVDEVSPNSHKYALWICSLGHKWEAQIKSRNSGNNCPYCNNRLVWTGFNDFQTHYPELAKQWSVEKNNPEDHPTLRAKRSNKVVWWKCSDCGKEWKTSFSDRAAGTNCPHCESRDKISKGEKAISYYLAKMFNVVENYKDKKLFGKRELDIYLPDYKIAIEYDGRAYHTTSHFDSDCIKNKICSDNGITLIRVREEGCPEIDGCIVVRCLPRFDSTFDGPVKEVIEHVCRITGILNTSDVNIERDSLIILEKKYNSIVVNSLGALYPELAKEFHPTLNKGLNPFHIPAQSNHKVWWMGACGHVFDAQVNSRTSHDQCCPICNGKRVLPGFNDLQTTNPELAKEWHPTKNGSKTAKDFTAGSEKKAWWMCSKGHEWQAAIVSRNAGRNCPYCSNKAVLTGYNDLCTLFPEIAKEWHPTKNGTNDPSKTSAGSNKRVWWLGSCGHEWEMPVIYRTSRKQGCRICNGKSGSIEKNVLTEYPVLKKYWDYSKNAIPPERYRPSSNKTVYWKCDLGHSWQQSIIDMTERQKCPYCSGNRLMSGFNDLRTKFPHIAAEWDYSKNENGPEMYKPGSNQKVWWHCKVCDRSWEAHISVRTFKGAGCRWCAYEKNGRRIVEDHMKRLGKS